MGPVQCAVSERPNKQCAARAQIQFRKDGVISATAYQRNGNRFNHTRRPSSGVSFKNIEMDSFLLEKLAVNAAQRRIHDFFRVGAKFVGAFVLRLRSMRVTQVATMTCVNPAGLRQARLEANSPRSRDSGIVILRYSPDQG